MNTQMTGRERILTTLKHEEPDRVPISPRIWAWLLSEFGKDDLATNLKECPDMDPMFIIPNGTLNILDAYPDTYNLPEVKVSQKKYVENQLTVVERTFHTPAGNLTDRTQIPPPGTKFGISPDPFKTEYLVKEPSDLDALRYITTPINKNFDDLHRHQKEIGDRGVIMVTISSPLDYQAGYARDMQDLMMDFYEDRPFFDELFEIYRVRTLEQIKAALEGGAEFIFGDWFFNSLSAGWSPTTFSEIFVPQIREHVELIHQYDAYYDYYDDGKLDGSMEMIASTGIDVLETCTPPPVGDMELAKAKEKIGKKTTLKGCIDLLLVVKDGTPELIENTVRETMEIAKPGGGFIIGSTDSFREGTPRENIHAYFEACKKFGAYN
jgi:uroporphyrinogen decarboxylase